MQKMKRIFVFLFLVFLLSQCHSLRLPAQQPVALSSPFVAKKPIRIALVLGGGGSRGLAHLGAIQELEEAGIRPDLIIGCSAGAIVGAFYADHPELKEGKNFLLQLKKADLLDTTFFNSRFGFVKGKALRKFMRKNLRAKLFEELKIPLIIVATDLFSGETVELWEGDIPSAVNASCAVPGVFRPVLLNNRYLVDGGVASPVPVEVAKKHGATFIIAIDVSEKLSLSKPYHLFGVAKRGIEIAYQKFVDHSLAQADVALKMGFQDIGMFSDHLNQQMYDTGRQKASEILPEIKKKLGIPIEEKIALH